MVNSRIRQSRLRLEQPETRTKTKERQSVAQTDVSSVDEVGVQMEKRGIEWAKKVETDSNTSSSRLLCGQDEAQAQLLDSVVGS